MAEQPGAEAEPRPRRRPHRQDQGGGRDLQGTYRKIPRNLLELRVKGDVFDYHFKDAVGAVGLEVRNIFAASKWLHLVSNANGEFRNYQTSLYRNGVYGNVGHYFRFLALDGRLSLTVGGRLLAGQPGTRRFRYRGWEASVRASVGITKKLRVSPHFSYQRERYQGPSTVLESLNRRDNRSRYGIDVNYRLGEKWSAEFSFYRVFNASNSPFNKYDQNVVSAGLSRRF